MRRVRVFFFSQREIFPFFMDSLKSDWSFIQKKGGVKARPLFNRLIRTRLQKKEKGTRSPFGREINKDLKSLNEELSEKSSKLQEIWTSLKIFRDEFGSLKDFREITHSFQEIGLELHELLTKKPASQGPFWTYQTLAEELQRDIDSLIEDIEEAKSRNNFFVDLELKWAKLFGGLKRQRGIYFLDLICKKNPEGYPLKELGREEEHYLPPRIRDGGISIRGFFEDLLFSFKEVGINPYRYYGFLIFSLFSTAYILGDRGYTYSAISLALYFLRVFPLRGIFYLNMLSYNASLLLGHEVGVLISFIGLFLGFYWKKEKTQNDLFVCSLPFLTELGGLFRGLNCNGNKLEFLSLPFHFPPDFFNPSTRLLFLIICFIFQIFRSLGSKSEEFWKTTRAFWVLPIILIYQSGAKIFDCGWGSSLFFVASLILFSSLYYGGVWEVMKMPSRWVNFGAPMRILLISFTKETLLHVILQLRTPLIPILSLIVLNFFSWIMICWGLFAIYLLIQRVYAVEFVPTLPKEDLDAPIFQTSRIPFNIPQEGIKMVESHLRIKCS